MRLLHVTQRYPPAIGGAEKYIADLSEELVQRGHQVDVFTSRALDFYTWKNELPRFEQLNGVNVYRFSAMRRRAWVWSILHFGLRHYWSTRSRWYEPLIFFGGGPLAPGMLWAILAQGRRYDLIHLSCLVYGHVAYGYWAARRLGVPVVVTPHAHTRQEDTYNLGYQRDVMFGCDHVIAVTPTERDLFLDLGLDPWRVSVAGNGLRPDDYPGDQRATARRRLGLPDEGFAVLFLGRKSDYKGLDVALEAYAALQRQGLPTSFLAVGPETDYSQALWPRYQGLPGLTVLGAVSDEEKLAALAACDCLVLPSIGEAFGIVFLEAWLMGKPVIGARVPAVSSVIDDGQDGWLAVPGDASDLAACIARLVADPDLARRMGATGRDKVLRRYTVPRIADRVEGIYLRVLRRRQRASGSHDRQPGTRPLEQGQ
jgi:glycosyltransferase involved in cell wall biosynthesis